MILDHVVLDVISAMYGEVSTSWATDYPTDAAFFFSRPYPQVAVDAFGYPCDDRTNIMHAPTAIVSDRDTATAPVPWDYRPDSSSGSEAGSPPSSQDTVIHKNVAPDCGMADSSVPWDYQPDNPSGGEGGTLQSSQDIRGDHNKLSLGGLTQAM